MIDPEQIVALYHQRRQKRQPMMDKRIQVLEQYNGDTLVPLPELDQQQKPAVANLLGLGLDQFAQRIASVLPDIEYPSLRPGFQTWDEKARQSRLANLGWWDMNRMELLEYKRARFLLAFACAPVSIHPTAVSQGGQAEDPPLEGPVPAQHLPRRPHRRTGLPARATTSCAMSTRCSGSRRTIPPRPRSSTRDGGRRSTGT